MARGRPLAWGTPQLALRLLHFLLWAKPAFTVRLKLSRAGGHQLAAGPEEGSHRREGGPSQHGAVVHFLFLLKDSLPNAEIWRDFFLTAHVGSWAAWAHCTDIDACQRDPSMKAFQLTLVPHVPSEWLIDLVSPEVRLMRSAMEQAPQGRGAMEKFVILGDTTLPVKPFPRVHWALTRSPESDYCYNTVEQWATANVRGRRYAIPKHWQWAVLNRTDALQLVRKWSAPIKRRYAWNLTLPDGTPVPRTRFTFSPEVPDEQIESVIWGPLELRTSHPREEMERFKREHRRCRTYCIYVPDMKLVEKATSRGLQILDARSNVTVRLISDPGTNFSGPQTYQHPVTFEHVGVTTMTALRDSPFLFARKFRHNVPQDWSRFFALLPGPAAARARG